MQRTQAMQRTQQKQCTHASNATQAMQALALHALRTLQNTSNVHKCHPWFLLAAGLHSCCMKNRIDSILVFCYARTACVTCTLLFFACVVFLHLLCCFWTFYFDFVLFRMQGTVCLVCVWMETTLYTTDVMTTMTLFNRPRMTAYYHCCNCSVINMHLNVLPVTHFAWFGWTDQSLDDTKQNSNRLKHVKVIN